MDTITVSKDDLVTTLIANQEQHRATYEKAMEGYKKAAKDWAREALEQLDHGDIPEDRLWFKSPIPEDHSEEYERLILMLQWDQADTVELDWSEFTQYVQDNWGWKKQWSVTNSTYGVG